MSVSLDPAVRAELWRHATAQRPLESCGYLLGVGDRVTGFRATRNVHPEPETRYGVDPLVFLDLEDELEGRDEEVLGIFHSHPATQAVPSATDLALAQPGWWYLILGFPPERPDGDLRAWKLHDGAFAEHAIETTEPTLET